MKADISSVIVNIEARVEMAMAPDRSSVSSPIFSHWISGRLPIGIAAIRQSPIIVIAEKPAAFSAKKSTTGTNSIRTRTYIQIRGFFIPLVIFDLAMPTPSRVMERNTVAFPR